MALYCNAVIVVYGKNNSSYSSYTPTATSFAKSRLSFTVEFCPEGQCSSVAPVNGVFVVNISNDDDDCLTEFTIEWSMSSGRGSTLKNVYLYI